MKKGTKVIVQLGHGAPTPGVLAADHDGGYMYKVRLKGEQITRKFFEDMVAIVGPPDEPKPRKNKPLKRHNRKALA